MSDALATPERLFRLQPSYQVGSGSVFTTYFLKLADDNRSDEQSTTERGLVEQGLFRHALLHLTATLKVHEDLNVLRESFVRRLDEYATAASGTAVTGHQVDIPKPADAMLQSIHKALVSWVSADVGAAIDGPTARANRVSHSVLLMLGYKGVLADVLADKRFVEGDLYTNSDGSVALDYFRESDRFTLVLTSQTVHALAYIEGRFLEAVFDPPQSSQLKARSFLVDLIGDTA